MQTALKPSSRLFMFLQYFHLGGVVYEPGTYLTNVLKFSGQEVGRRMGVCDRVDDLAVFFVGLIADRYFSSEKLLAVLGIAGGVVWGLLPQMKGFAWLLSNADFVFALLRRRWRWEIRCRCTISDLEDGFSAREDLSAVGWIGGRRHLSVLKGEQSSIQFNLAGGLIAR